MPDNTTLTLQQVLLAGNYVSEEDLQTAEKNAASAKVSLADYLIENGIVNKDIIGQAYAEFYKIPYVDLNSNIPSTEQILSVPEQIAREFRVVLSKDTDAEVTITTDTPSREGLQEAMEKGFKKKVIIGYSLTEDIDSVLLKYAKPLETRFSKIIASSERVAPEILDEIFADALSLRASDIHFEPRKVDVEVRFRVDGVLHEAGRIPKEYFENILNRLKVMSHQRIDEHHSAQDGVLRFEREGKAVDMRSSVVPTVDGEKVVLRILSSYVQGLALGDLGLNAEHEKLLRAAADKPFGMLLVTGPTGSGKTTTLYGLLKLLNQPDVNITTIEDPVEYKMEQVNQIQVNSDAGLSFADGLRSIVRQDPDIILVGEIRDSETAEIAVNAALTGHLLLSTFHANDAATAIPRLLDMKIEPFLLSSTLILIIAQRLVRRTCDACRVSVPITDPMFTEQLKKMRVHLEGVKTLYHGKGCAMCSGTGFIGRVGIFEFIPVTPEVQQLVLTNPSAQEIWKVARSQGATSLFENGLEKVKEGVTTLAELMRVAEAPVETPIAVEKRKSSRAATTKKS